VLMEHRLHRRQQLEIATRDERLQKRELYAEGVGNKSGMLG